MAIHDSLGTRLSIIINRKAWPEIRKWIRERLKLATFNPCYNPVDSYCLNYSNWTFIWLLFHVEKYNSFDTLLY